MFIDSLNELHKSLSYKDKLEQTCDKLVICELISYV